MDFLGGGKGGKNKLDLGVIHGIIDKAQSSGVLPASNTAAGQKIDSLQAKAGHKESSLGKTNNAAGQTVPQQYPQHGAPGHPSSGHTGQPPQQGYPYPQQNFQSPQGYPPQNVIYPVQPGPQGILGPAYPQQPPQGGPPSGSFQGGYYPPPPQMNYPPNYPQYAQQHQQQQQQQQQPFYPSSPSHPSQKRET